MIRVVGTLVGVVAGLVLGLWIFAVQVLAGIAYRFTKARHKRKAKRAHRAFARTLGIPEEEMSGRLRFEAFVWDREGRPAIDDETRRALLESIA